jgi:predicted esterase
VRNSDALIALTLFSSPALVACSDSAFDDDRWSRTTPTPPPRVVPAECNPPSSLGAGAVESAPRIELIGASVLEQPLGEPYADAGATAEGAAAGDLSAYIEVEGIDSLDVEKVGDYLIRYTVTDPDNAASSEAVRIVRVSDGQNLARQSERPLGSTSSPLGYFEHLPRDYGHPNATFPLLVFNHGIGEAYNWTEQDEDEFGRSPHYLDRLLRRGLTALIQTDAWDSELPFVVLSPQRCLLATDVEVAYLHDFVAYAERTYRIDRARIYMIGFSAGSFITWEYTIRHSDELAATVHISGGGSVTAGCALKKTPTWAFHARDDMTVPIDDEYQTLFSINACAPAERPKFTIFPHGGHLIDNEVLDGSAMGQAESGSDRYDQSLYAWLLQHQR